MENEYVKLWVSYESYFEPLSPEEVGRLALAMLKYKIRGEEPSLSGNERFVWPAIRRDIDAQTEAQRITSDLRSEAGKKGGRPSKQSADEKANVFSEKQKKQMLFSESKKSNGQGQGHGQGQGQKEKNISIEILKKKFGEFENVVLTGEEHEKLVDSLGDIGAKEYIERLSSYLAQSGRRYKSHYATLLNWWRKDGKPVSRSKGNVVIKPDKEREITPDMTAEELF